MLPGPAITAEPRGISYGLNRSRLQSGHSNVMTGDACSSTVMGLTIFGRAASIIAVSTGGFILRVEQRQHELVCARHVRIVAPLGFQKRG